MKSGTFERNLAYEKNDIKTYLLLIVYAIILVLVVVHLERILRAIGHFVGLFKPLLIGIVIICQGLFQIVYQVFDNYMAGQCKEAVILGCMCFVGMTILRLDYAALISVIIAVTASVPILGAYIGGTIGVLLLLFVALGKAVLFLVFLLILQQVEGNVIYPRVVGKKIGLPGLWVLLAISVGGGLVGIWGMLLSVPVTTVCYQFLKRDVRNREQRLKDETTI